MFSNIPDRFVELRVFTVAGRRRDIIKMNAFNVRDFSPSTTRVRLPRHVTVTFFCARTARRIIGNVSDILTGAQVT